MVTFADAGVGTGSQSGAVLAMSKMTFMAVVPGQLQRQAARRREVESLAVPK